MKIYVDADACPVVRIVEQAAREKGISVTLLCDTNHVLHSEYSEVKIIGAGADAVDFALINLCRKHTLHRSDAGLRRRCHGAWQRRLCDSSVRKVVY